MGELGSRFVAATIDEEHASEPPEKWQPGNRHSIRNAIRPYGG